MCAAGRKWLTLCEHILPQQNCTPCYTIGQNTRLTLPAPACQNLQTRQQPLRSKGPPSPVALPARRAAPAKPLLFVVVTIQYADLCWGTKLIWWSSPSRRFSTKQHKTVQGSSLLRKSLYCHRKWHQFYNQQIRQQIRLGSFLGASDGMKWTGWPWLLKVNLLVNVPDLTHGEMRQ